MPFSFPDEIYLRWIHKTLLERAKFTEHAHSFCHCIFQTRKQIRNAHKFFQSNSFAFSVKYFHLKSSLFLIGLFFPFQCFTDCCFTPCISINIRTWTLCLVVLPTLVLSSFSRLCRRLKQHAYVYVQAHAYVAVQASLLNRCFNALLSFELRLHVAETPLRKA